MVYSKACIPFILINPFVCMLSCRKKTMIGNESLTVVAINPIYLARY